ncbi:MAG: hypothetical protein ACPGWR_29175 [Ardenticatenaceae bacterium]
MRVLPPNEQAGMLVLASNKQAGMLVLLCKRPRQADDLDKYEFKV